MTISLDADKIQHPFMRSGTQGMYLNIIKAIYSKTTVNIKLNGKEIKTILLKSGTKKTVHSFHIYSIQYSKF